MTKQNKKRTRNKKTSIMYQSDESLDSDRLLKGPNNNNENTKLNTKYNEGEQQINARRERRRSIWAPAATKTRFADVPVLTICPYCNQKVVTKTQFRRGKKNW